MIRFPSHLWRLTLACLLAGAAIQDPRPATALSVDSATGAPTQLGGASTMPSTATPSGGNQSGITSTPLPPAQQQPIQQPEIEQPTVQQPTMQQPTVQIPQAPVVAPVAHPTASPNPGASSTDASPAGASTMSMSPGQAANTLPAGTPATNTPGLFDDQHQGLGIRLWQGNSVGQLTALLPLLSAPVTQPSLRDLQLRLLLTQASGPIIGTTAIGDSLVPLRAERLRAMGFETEAALILKQAGADTASADPQTAVEKLLIAGDDDAACEMIKKQVTSMPRPASFWRRAVIFCQILGGQNDQASIGIDLLREQANSDPRNKDFVAVASILMGDSKPQSLKTPITHPDPLLAAMMKRARLKVSSIAGTPPPPPTGVVAQAALARDATKALGDRIKAAEFAFAAGLLPADEVTGLYLQVPPAAGIAALSGPDTPEHRGQLYQLTQRGQMPASRVPLIAEALREAMLRGDYFTALPFYLPFLQQITPNPSLAWFASDAARALLAAGNIDKGSYWLNLAESAGANQDVAKAVPGLRLLARIAGVYGVRDASSDPVADWRAVSGASDAAAQRLYGILAGLGDPIGNHAGASLSGSGDANIGVAAQSGRRGETVLRALILLAGRGLAQADGASLAQSLGGLSTVGLGKDARRIAVEAAIWSGV